MPALVALRAWFGQDEANHGTMRYRVDPQGIVQVPPEAAAFLVAVGGFALPKRRAARTADTRPDRTGANGLVRLHHDDAVGCSFAGCQYPSDVNGDVLVPAAAAAELIAHGFVPTASPATQRQESCDSRPRRRVTESAAGSSKRG
ncbi:MAG: hypothetical protein ACREE2_00945 [Stellaceae bacterium]